MPETGLQALPHDEARLDALRVLLLDCQTSGMVAMFEPEASVHALPPSGMATVREPGEGSARGSEWVQPRNYH